MSCFLNYSFIVTGDCTNTNSGAFNLSIYGEAPDYTIEWVYPSLGTIPLGAGVTGYTVDSLSAGTYTFNVIDSCDRNTVIPVNVYISSGTCVSIVKSDTSCNFNNGSITGITENFYGSSSFYLFEITLGYISSGTSFTNMYSFYNLSPGIYYIVADDGGGCVGTSPSCIVESSGMLDFRFYIVNDSGCAVNLGKIFITGITGNGPYTYLWSTGEITSSISGLSEGNYSVQVTDSEGCSITKTATVQKVPLIGLGSFIDTINPSCFTSDGEVTVMVTGGTAPYYYSGSNGSVYISFSQSQTFVNLAPGLFSVQVTDAALCNFVASTTILPPGGFSIVEIGINSSKCNNIEGSIDPITIFGGSGNYTYILEYPDGHVITYNTSSQVWQFTGLSGGTYTLAIMDGVCTFVGSYTIQNEDLFTLTAVTTGTTCNSSNGVINISISEGGTPPYIYSINGNSFGPTSLTAYTFNNLSYGVYSVSVTDTTGCVQSDVVSVDYSESVGFILASVDSLNGSNGEISAFITNGNPPFTLVWSDNVNGQTGYTVTNLSADTYTLTVTDDNGCVKSNSVVINGINTVESYQVYNICDNDFINSDTLIKKGPRQMLNEGFHDLTSGDTNCILNYSIFEVVVSVSGESLSTVIYTGYTLNDYPLDNDFYGEVENLLLQFDGIGNVIIDIEENVITILTDCDTEITLSDAQVIVNLVIHYNISCVECET